MGLTRRADHAIRIACAFGLLLALFLARWDFDIDHFDFRVWSTADVLLDEGLNPYDSEVMNERLLGRFPPLPGEDVDPLHFFNPPTWITQLRLIGVSAFVMSLVGGVALFGSILVLAKDAGFERTLGYLFGTSYFLYLVPSMTTFRLGQTGFFLAGLVGLRLVLIGSRIGGVPVALLSFKPHLALASGFSELASSTRLRLAAGTAATFLALLALQLTQDGLSPWSWWAGSLGESRSFGRLTDMSFRTISRHLDLHSAAGLPSLVAGIVGATVLSIRWKAADQRLLTLMSLALVAYLSGHAFVHDWLWLTLVPVVCRWTVLRTLTVAIVYATVYTYYRGVPADSTDVGPNSLLALGACVYLVHAARTSARSRRVTSEPESHEPGPLPHGREPRQPASLG